MVSRVPKKEEPLDWYLWVGALTGAALLLVVAPDFVTSAIKGKFDPSLLIPQQVRQAVNNGSAASSGNAFEESLQFTLKWEGNSCDNHPADIGGLTCKGILDSEYRAWRKAQGQSEQSVQSMTDTEMKAIYKGYWDRCKAGDRPMPLALAIFDTCVNFDESKVQDWFQNLPSDPKQAALKIVESRIAYRHQRVQEKADQQAFLQGWLNRDNALKEFIDAYQLQPQAQAKGQQPATEVSQQSIARLQIGKQVCSGFMVAQSVLLTAGHCFRGSNGTAQITLDGKQTTGRQRAIVANDVAIVDVDGSFSYFESVDAQVGQSASIPGYPLGNWKVVSGDISKTDSRGNWKVTTSEIVKSGTSGAPLLVNGKWSGVVIGGNEPQATVIPRSRIGSL